MAIRKVPERDERLIEEFNKLKNPQAQPLSKLKATKTRKAPSKKPKLKEL
jgi:hypothetical protein